MGFNDLGCGEKRSVRRVAVITRSGQFDCIQDGTPGGYTRLKVQRRRLEPAVVAVELGEPQRFRLHCVTARDWAKRGKAIAGVRPIHIPRPTVRGVRTALKLWLEATCTASENPS